MLDEELWERTENPWTMLQHVSEQHLQQLANNEQFCQELNRLSQKRELLNEADILKLAVDISRLGVKHYVLQECRQIETKVTIFTNTIDIRTDSKLAIQLNDLFETLIIRA